MPSLVPIIIYGLMIAGCQPKIIDAYFVTVPIEQIGPEDNEDYKTWSSNTFSLVKSSAGFYCAGDNTLTLATKDLEKADALAQHFSASAPVKHNFKSYTEELDCKIQDGHTIRINLSQPLDGAQYTMVESQTIHLPLFDLTTESAIGADRTKAIDGGFELKYPKSYKHIQKDAELRLQILRNEFGDDCCEISEQSFD